MVQRLMENEFDEDFDFGSIKGLDRLQSMIKKEPRQTNKPGLHQLEKSQEIGEIDFSGENFDFQYCASRYEQGWLTESLGYFYEQHWIKDVLRMIKGGKEASVYQCLAGDSTDTIYLAAKVYRPKQFRNLKNDYVYRENRDYLDENGHVIRDTRMNHAIRKKTDYGQQLTHISWIEHEIKTMEVLKSAGADIPKPYASGENAILMSYVGGDDLAAPTLNEISLPPDLAKRLLDRVIFNIELMLANQRVHADLSAFNILFWDDQITIIDFPQAIDPTQNPNSWQIFKRDVVRVCQYFQRQNVKIEPNRLAYDLWKKFRLPPVIDVDFSIQDLEEKSNDIPVKNANAIELGL